MLWLNYRFIKVFLFNFGERIINCREKQMLRNKLGLQEEQYLLFIFNI